MRLSYIVSGAILILPTINFAVAVPVPIREKRQTGVDVAHTPAVNMLGKRGGELDQALKLFSHPESHSPPKPVELSAARPSPSPPTSGSADGSTDVEQALVVIPKEPSPLSNPDHALQSPGGEKKMWLNLNNPPEDHVFASQEESSAARPLLSSQLLGHADGSMGIKQPSIPETTSQVSRPDHPPLGAGDGLRPSIPKGSSSVSSSGGAEPNKPWLNLFGPPGSYFLAKPGESSATHWRPSSSSKLSRPADGGIVLKQMPPSIPKEPSQVYSSGNRPVQVRPNLFGHPGSYLLASSVTRWHPSGLRLSWPTVGGTDVNQPLPSIPKNPSPVSSSGDQPDKLWPNLIGHPGSYLPKNPGESSSTHWHPSSSSQPSRPAVEWTNVNQRLPPIPEDSEPSPVSSPEYTPPRPGSLTDSGYEFMNSDAPPRPLGLALPIESGHEVDAPPLSPVSMTNPDGQWMGVGSPSGKRKRP